VAVGIGGVLAAASVGAILGRVSESSESYKGLASFGGALVGAGVAGLAGATTAAASRRYRRAGIAAAVTAFGGLGTLVLLAALAKKASGATVVVESWEPVTASTQLQPGVEYRFSDAMTAQDMQNPPTLAEIQALLGPLGFNVESVWVSTPPVDWPSDDRGANRAYMQFQVSKPGIVVPSTTGAAKLYEQKALVA